MRRRRQLPFSNMQGVRREVAFIFHGMIRRMHPTMLFTGLRRESWNRQKTLAISLPSSNANHQQYNPGLTEPPIKGHTIPIGLLLLTGDIMKVCSVRRCQLKQEA